MRNLLIVVLVLLVPVMLCAEEEKAAEKKFKNTMDELSYTLGFKTGTDIKSLGIEINLDMYLKAVKEVYEGKETVITEEEAITIYRTFFEKRKAEMETKKLAAGEENLKKGKEFLAENKKQKGVMTTESGLQYQVITEGKGVKPKATDRVTVNYRGLFLDGNEFDSSYKREKPTTFVLDKVIKGWTEGLQLMNVGSKYKFYIPSDLAYGPRGMGNTIPPNSELIFEIEFIGIEEEQKEPEKETSK